MDDLLQADVMLNEDGTVMCVHVSLRQPHNFDAEIRFYILGEHCNLEAEYTEDEWVSLDRVLLPEKPHE